jgi:WD40 repeat protein
MLREFQGSSKKILCVQFLPDSRHVAASGEDGILRVWNKKSGQLAMEFPVFANGGIVLDLAFTPDGRYCLVPEISVIHVVEMPDEVTGTANADSVKSEPPPAAAPPSSPPGQLRQFSGHVAAIRGVSFSPDGRSGLSSSADGTVRLWNLDTGEEIRQFTCQSGPLWRIAFSPDGRTFVVGGDGHWVGLWDVKTGLELDRFVGHNKGIQAVRFFRDGKRFVSAAADRTVRVWDIASGLEIQKFRSIYGMTSIAFLQDERYLVAGSGNEKAVVFDLLTERTAGHFTGHTASVQGVDVSADDRFLLTAGGDKTIRLWDVQTRKEIRKFIGHRDIVYRALFMNNDQIVLSASQDGTIRFWDRGSGAELHRIAAHQGGVVDIALSADGTRFLSGGRDSVLRLWRMPAKGWATVLSPLTRGDVLQ